MTGVQTLLARAALGCAATVATVLLPYFRPAFEWSERTFRRRYLLLFGGLRVLLFLAVFLVLHIAARGDLPGIYIPEIQSHLLGRVPYRDYLSSYAPLFPYFYTPLYRLHPSPLTLIAFSIAAEVATAWISLRFMPRVLSEQGSRVAALLCLVNPISLQFVTIDGQNNVWIGLALAVALLALAQRREALSGAAVGASIAGIKFLPLLFTPVFPLALRRRALLWIAGCAAVVMAVYGFFVGVLHAPVLQAIQREGQIKSAGGLPFLVEAALGRDLGRLGWDLLLVVALGAVWLWGWRASRHAVPYTRGALALTTFLLPALLLTLMGLGKKTWPTYTEMVLFPLAMVIARAATGEDAGRGVRPALVAVLGAFSLLSVTAHSVWASMLSQAGAVQVHALLRVGSGPAWLLMVLEAGLFATYAALAGISCVQAGRAAADRG
ncbi:glycosyltransferase family 87 protein [Terriglobus aquaticus]|uniref:Glycosyltransferase family 87 protein n=1 Tax=Terriglobus aquaticus TaxID=940139 RepID=A0ABW9KM98_9BACT|nr:glycosyltransferase family 87 protein [Terriglobus aquaticus]